MAFLELTDYDTFINPQLFQMLLEGNDKKRTDAEELAAGHIYSSLSGRYNLQAEFAKTGDGRNKTLIRWMLSLSVYHIHNTVPDTDIPERVAKNYDDARKDIAGVASGKAATDLMVLSKPGGRNKTRFRWGSSPKRSHDPFA